MRDDLNGVDKEKMTSLVVGLRRWRNGLKGEVEGVMTNWRVYRTAS